MLPLQSNKTSWMRWKEPLTPRCTPLFFSQSLKPVCLYTNSGNEEQLQRCTTAGTSNSSACVWDTHILPGNNSFDVTAHESNLCKRKKHKADIITGESTDFKTLDSQSHFNLIDGCDTIGAVSVGYGRVLLAGIVAKQQDLLAVEGVFRPSDI